MAEIVMIPIEQLYPHPNNPRKDLGDLTELSESIKANGILQNLTVVPGRRGTNEEIAQIQKLYDSLAGDTELEKNAMAEIREQIDNRWVVDGYTIIIGHRRHAAAKQAGLTELPCVIVNMDSREQMQTMLIENMQRSDLTVYEQAQGFQMMLDLGATVEEIAEKSGFSTNTVRRRVKWMELDQAKFKTVTEERQISITDLDRLSQIEDLAARNECLDKIGTSDFNMAIQKVIKRQTIDANIPKVKAWLKEVKAKQIKDGDRWSNKYDRIGSTIYIDKLNEPGNTFPDGISNKPVFYFLGKKDSYEYGQLVLYHEHQKAPPVKRDPEEIAKDKAIKAAWDKLDNAAATAYDLRNKFVSGLTVTKKNEPLVTLGAVYAGCYNALSYNSADRTSMYKLTGIEDSGYIPDREEKFWAGFEKISGDDWAKLVYSMFGDAVLSATSTGFRKSFPVYGRNIKLELIYRWLCTLGYDMSTEEAQLLSGDHEAYHAKDAFKGEES